MSKMTYATGLLSVCFAKSKLLLFYETLRQGVHLTI